MPCWWYAIFRHSFLGVPWTWAWKHRRFSLQITIFEGFRGRIKKKNSEIIIPVPYDEIPPKKNIQKTLWFRKLEFLSFWVPSHGGYFIGDWIKARTHHKITSILGGWRPWHPTFHPMKNPIKSKSIPSHHIPSQLPSGKRLHSYGKSLFLMGKSTRNGHFQ